MNMDTPQARMGAAGGAHGLSLHDKAACIYLVLPLAMFCLWFSPLIATVLLGLSGYGVYHALRRAPSSRSTIPRGFLLAIVALSLAWTALAGIGHFFYANLDWVVRDAVLHDLTSMPWPPKYLAGEATTLILRAPVAYYLPAAGLGHLLGPGAANFALYLWTALGWGLVLVSACSLFNARRERIACLLVLALFGGMDLLGFIWSARHLPEMGEHVEWWMPYIQYSSNSTLLFWVPNHAIPAWLGVILILRHWQRPELARITPLLAAAIPLWSPLAAIGLFPFFLFALAWRRDAKLLFSRRSCLPFIPIALVAALYLGLDAMSVPHGWMMETAPNVAAFAYRYVLFCLLEFGVVALVLARLVSFSPPMRVAVGVLCILPFLYYGPGNDLGMRASIPALLVLAMATIKPLVDTNHSLWRSVLIVALAIGAMGSSQEVVRALVQRSWMPLHQSIPQAVSMQSPNGANVYPPHYFARLESDGFGRLVGNSRPIDRLEPGKSP